MSDTTHELTNWQIAERADFYDVQHGGEPTRLRPGTVVMDYLSIVDEALTLPLDDEHQWSIFGIDDHWAVDILDALGSPDDRCNAIGASLAQAICKAWWQWMNERHDA